MELEKKYVPVTVHFDANGKMRPIEIEFDEMRRYHIDTNEHVNNCQYVQMAMDYLPENFKIHQMRAEYKQQARLNDVICPARAVDENKTTVLLNDQKGEPYAVVEFK